MATATTATTKSIRGTTTTIHPDFLVGSKLRQHHQQSFREHVSAPTSDFARKQLEKMGWSDGTGLGKKRDGMTSHIRVKRRKDQLGLGGSEKPEVVLAVGESEWWKDSLGATLAKLSGKKKSKDKKDKKSKKKKSNKKEQDSSSSSNPGKTFTDEELFQATGGARFGMRAGITTNLHKWVRTEKDASVQGPASDESSDSVKKEKEVELSSSSTDKETKKKSKKRTAEDGECQSTSDTPSEPASKKQRKKEKKEKNKKSEVQPNESVDAATAEVKSQKEKKKSKKSKTSRKD